MLGVVEQRAGSDRRDYARGGRRTGEKPGPKPLDGEPLTQLLVIRLNARHRAELDQVAAEMDADVTAIVRDAVNDFVADFRERKVFNTDPVLQNKK